MKLDGRRLAVFVAVLGFLIQGAYCIQITASGGGNGESGSVSMTFDTLKSTSVSSQIAINGATVTPLASIVGPITKFEQTHSVKDTSGKSASVYVKVLNAPSGLTYTSKVLPSEGNVPTTTQVSAEQWLTVPKADSIKCTATASYGTTRSASVGLEEARSTVAGDYVTLTGYYDKAVTTGTLTQAYQKATSGAANSIKIYGTAKDSSGTYSVSTPLKGLSGGRATFTGLSETSSAGTTTQIVQKEHVHGTFTSTATFTPTTGTAQTKTRTSNYGTEYDINMKSAKGSLPTGILGYYVKPGTTASKIQGAVNAAQSSDTINVAAGTYLENVNINKGLTLKGTGSPTATSFALNAILGTGSGGITAPMIYVNPTAKIQDGVTLASSGGTVNVAAGTYKENVMIDKSLKVKGAGSTKTIVDGNKKDSVFSVGIVNHGVNVDLSNIKIQNGKTEREGGGIYNYGTTTLTGCAISGNTAMVGGGISNRGMLTVQGNSIISGNTATSGDGGGIENSVYWNGNKFFTPTMTITGSTITGNYAANRGGGIYNGGTATVTGTSVSSNTAKSYGGGIANAGMLTIQESSTISKNKAQYGGGIYNYGMPTGTLKLTNSIISGNYANYLGGGLQNDGTATIRSCTISGNSAARGGGICNDAFTSLSGNIIISTMTVTGCTISGNNAFLGGGIYNMGKSTIGSSTVTKNNAKGSGLGSDNKGFGGGIYCSGPGTSTVIDSTISENSAAYSGGGIYNGKTLFGSLPYPSILNVKDSAISKNTAKIGGGISNDATATITGSTVSKNYATVKGGGIYNYKGAQLNCDISQVYGNYPSQITRS